MKLIGYTIFQIVVSIFCLVFLVKTWFYCTSCVVLKIPLKYFSIVDFIWIPLVNFWKPSNFISIWSSQTVSMAAIMQRKNIFVHLRRVFNNKGVYNKGICILRTRFVSAFRCLNESKQFFKNHVKGCLWRKV